MKKSTAAALLSGLVFPGLGHLYLKRWIPGILFGGIAGTATYYIVSIAVNIALDIVEKIQSGAVSSDVDSISVLVSQQLSASEQATNMATMALLACWVIGIIDSYRQGRAQENSEV
jgi:TM2 domain-containing membrane protein YozV